MVNHSTAERQLTGWTNDFLSIGGHSKGSLGNNCLLLQNISQWFIFDSSNKVVLRCSGLSWFGEELLVVKLDSKTCDICFHAQPTNRGSQHPRASQQKRSVAGKKKYSFKTVEPGFHFSCISASRGIGDIDPSEQNRRSNLEWVEMSSLSHWWLNEASVTSDLVVDNGASRH